MFLSKVVGVAVFFALLLKPAAVEETEEIDHVLRGKMLHYRGDLIRSQCLRLIMNAAAAASLLCDFISSSLPQFQRSSDCVSHTAAVFVWFLRPL